MIVFDKAQWHIDAGEDYTEVISKFKIVFQFLDGKGLLTEEGKEMLEFGIDSSISLNERMVNDEGAAFLENCYDAVVNFPACALEQALEDEFAEQE